MKSSYRGIVPFLSILMLVVVAGGWWYTRIRENEVLTNVGQSLDTIARQKAKRIAQWRAEQLRRGAALSDYPTLSSQITTFLRTGDATTEAQLSDTLRFICKGNGYHDAQLATAEGLVRLSLKGDKGWIHADALESIERALRTKTPTLNDIHRHKNDITTQMELVTPLCYGPKSAGPPIAAIILPIDPSDSLEPILQQRSDRSETAEVLLVRREGSSVVFLNQYRHEKGDLRLQSMAPISATHLPSVRAVLGEEGVAMSDDYRGVPVMAALKGIPASPWFLVVKVDKAEALATWHSERKLLYGCMTVLCGALMTMIAIAIGSRIKAGRGVLSADEAHAPGKANLRHRLQSVDKGDATFKRLFDNSAEPAFLLEDDRIEDCNRAALEALRAVSVDQIRRRSLTDFAPLQQPDGNRSSEKMAEMAARASSQGAQIFEWECARMNGDRFSVEAILTAMTQGSRPLLHAVWRDITQRKENEKRLLGIADFNEKLIAASSLGILAYDAAGACVMANDAAARMLDTPTHELLQQNFRFLETWKICGLFSAAESVLSSGNERKIDLPYPNPSGKSSWIEGYLVRFYSQGRPHLLVTFSDVSEHRRTATARTQLASIIESTSDFVATASPDGSILYLNRTARLFLGIGEADEPGGRSLLSILSAASSETVSKIGIPTAMRDGIWRADTEIINAQGLSVPHSQLIIAHRSSEGKLERISTIARDQSAQKQIDRIMEARIHLLEKSATTNLEQFLTAALDEIEIQTGSTIGFYHFMDADQENLKLQAWSSNTLQHMCKADGKGQHYPISQAGIWCDCVRLKRPIIHNDYGAIARPMGLPAGHAALIRELTLPLLREGRIVAIIGVGNKPHDYDEKDIEVAQIIGDFSWEIVEHKRAEALQRDLIANLKDSGGPG